MGHFPHRAGPQDSRHVSGRNMSCVLRVLTLVGAFILIVLGAGPIIAQQDPGLVLVRQLQNRPTPEGWTLQPQGEATLLRNAGDPNASHVVLYTPTPAGDLIRSTLMIARLASHDPKAHIAVLLVGPQGTCMLGLFADRSAEVTCAAGGRTVPHGLREDVLNLDGNDRIQLLEHDGEAVFFVNHQEVGRMSGHPALGHDLALAFSGRADFMISSFSVAHMTAEEPSGPAAPPLAGEGQPENGIDAGSGGAFFDVAPAPARAGWTQTRAGAGIALVNETVQGDERLLVLNLPFVPGGLRMTEVDVSIAPARNGRQSLRAAAGILLENPDQGKSCGVQITAAGDGLLLCYVADGRGVEVARQQGIARGVGPHRLAVTERGDELVATVNGTVIGSLKAHPVIGGQVALIAWDRGHFGFTPVRLQTETASTLLPPTRFDPGLREAAADHLDGPLPLFAGDRARADAAYLGVTQSILMHELGHALIGELGVPATGPEEDAVDIYAALHLADTVVQSAAQSGGAAKAASYASLLWYYSGRLEENRITPVSQSWQDEHTGGMKRFRNMFCVIYGADPRGFAQLAQSVGLEERTLMRCEDEFLKQRRAWRAILAPYARLSTTMPEGRLTATAPGAEVLVDFQPSRRQVGEYLRRNHEAELTRVAQDLGRAYALPRPLTVTFQDCEVMNAWYHPQEGSVTMCYNIVEHFVVMISDIELATVGGHAVAARTQPRLPQLAGTAAQVTGQPAPADAELVDFGIPAGLHLFAPPFRGPTPVDNPQARTITTPELQFLIETEQDVVVFDIREGAGLQSLPGAWQLAGSGRDGSLQDSLQLRLGEVLLELAGPHRNRPVVVLGEGPDDRAAWNAALRIGKEGYATSWYRGGLSAWRAAGLPLSQLK